MRNQEGLKLKDLFDIKGKVAAITGGAGVLCSEMAVALGNCGVKVAILDLNEDKARMVAEKINAAGGSALAVKADVLNKKSLEEASDIVLKEFGRVDVLINGAGGNKKEATTSEDMSFFNIPIEAMQWVFNLNFMGTVLATQVFEKSWLKKAKAV